MVEMNDIKADTSSIPARTRRLVGDPQTNGQVSRKLANPSAVNAAMKMLPAASSTRLAASLNSERIKLVSPDVVYH